MRTYKWHDQGVLVFFKAKDNLIQSSFIRDILYVSFIPTVLANVIGHSTHLCIIDDLGGIMGPCPVHVA